MMIQNLYINMFLILTTELGEKSIKAWSKYHTTDKTFFKRFTKII